MLYLARALEAWQQAHPRLPKAPEYLQEAARLYQEELGDARKARAVYRTLYEQYPKAKQSGTALYKMAEIEHVDLHEWNEARLHYRQFLANYPNHPNARLAQEAMTFLTKTEDELFRQVQDSIRAKAQQAPKTDSR